MGLNMLNDYFLTTFGQVNNNKEFWSFSIYVSMYQNIMTQLVSKGSNYKSRDLFDTKCIKWYFDTLIYSDTKATERFDNFLII
jgi:hypothetical protein